MSSRTKFKIDYLKYLYIKALLMQIQTRIPPIFKLEIKTFEDCNIGEVAFNFDDDWTDALEGLLDGYAYLMKIKLSLSDKATKIVRKKFKVKPEEKIQGEGFEFYLESTGNILVQSWLFGKWEDDIAEPLPIFSAAFGVLTNPESDWSAKGIDKTVEKWKKDWECV